MVFDETELVSDRSKLRTLRQAYPDWSFGKLARELGHCRGWVKKWLRRFTAAAPDDQLVLLSVPMSLTLNHPNLQPCCSTGCLSLENIHLRT